MIGQEELYTIRQQDILRKGASGNVNSLYTVFPDYRILQFNMN